jgi:hypothetical protein
MSDRTSTAMVQLSPDTIKRTPMGTAATVGAPEGIIIRSREEKAQWTRTTAANTKVHHTVAGLLRRIRNLSSLLKDVTHLSDGH